jgi:cellulose synthase/poly-beta-1,6-N-acetylglucosamine synthase-like glycosyltransferase
MLDRTNKIPEPEAESALPPPDGTLQKFSDLRRYIRSGMAPWRILDGWKQEFLCNHERVSAEDLGMKDGSPLPLRAYRVVTGPAFARQLHRRFGDDAQRRSIERLKNEQPTHSAAGVLSNAQRLLFSTVFIAAAACLWLKPVAMLVALNSVVTAYFISAIFFRVYLFFLTAGKGPAKTAHATDLTALPVITVLLPLYRETEALPSLSRAMNELEYPPDKLDIKLLLEEDDVETIREARRLGLSEQFEMLIVPEGGPKTKPKACNFGMCFARGDLIVIYDAEDQPEPDQLLKAAAAFQDAPADLACVQARLNYYNRRDNWLTRQFTLEYSLWFDWLLPALQRMNAPIPLGGTSNFLRTDVLYDVGGWDPFNVTEDADLGLRLSKLGYRVEVLDSTTYEEANCRIRNWIRQRSRWMKGYLQTWLVHMRRPGAIVSTTGWRGLLAVLLFVAGNVLSALINPVLWAVFAVWLFTGAAAIAAVFPGPLLWLNFFALAVGNAFFILLAVIAPMRRGWLGLSLYGLTAPLYWGLTSLAAYKAVWQIVTRPYFWEKTDHVISGIARKKRDDALKARHVD